ncbi:MAG: hypothetical protein DWQ07_13430 [Chloroflexi bacterium]|nr:MAG: hypothetical protein DWQ07_13430 [Chloroflexota bacterium]MBL1196762.1 hypothetical protein [Chloroflexota bacterium]NOH14056.1 hypothetical protein [Chloroflexota bacterium]
MVEETVSRPARILEVAIKAGIFGIAAVPIITITQLITGEIVDVFNLLFTYMFFFLTTGVLAMLFYRGVYGHDALAILAAGALAGGATGLLSGISNAFLSLHFQPLNDNTGAVISIYILCMCPLLFIGAVSGGASAWVMTLLPLNLLGIHFNREATEEKKDTDIARAIALETKIEEEKDADKEEQREPENERESAQENDPNTLTIEDGETDLSDPTVKLRHAIRLIETDQKAEAQKMLVELTREQKLPDPLVWLWLASTFDDEPATKRRCIQKVLEIHPTSPVALEMLNNLEKPIQPPIPPPPVKRVPITYKPEVADEPQEFSPLINRFWYRFGVRILMFVILAIIVFVCDSLNSLFR